MMNNNKFNTICLMAFVLILAMISSKAENIQRVAKSEKNNRLNLKIKYTDAKTNDTLFLYVSNRFTSGWGLGNPKSYKAVRTNEGLFSFDVPVSANYGYFELYGIRSKVGKSGRNLMPLLWPQFWEMKDSIFIEISYKNTGGPVATKCVFSGRGAVKYTARNEIQQKEQPRFDLPLLNTVNYGSYPMSSNIAIQQLNQFRQLMSNLSFQVLKADLHFYQYHGMFYALKSQYDTLLKSGIEKSVEAFKTIFYTKFGNETFPEFEKKSLANAAEYLGYCFEKSRFLAYLENTDYTSSDLFHVLVNNYSGEVRDVLLVKYLQDSKRSGSSIDEFEKAESLIKDKECKIILGEMRRSLPGRVFNDYYLTDIAGKQVKLSDYDDKILMVDFWFTGCGGCSNFYKKTLSKVEEHFMGNSKVVFLSISIDKKITNWRESVVGGDYTSGKAVNLFTSGLGVEHPITQENWIRDFPFAILMDRGRKIEEYNSEVLFNYDSLVSRIQRMLN